MEQLQLDFDLLDLLDGLIEDHDDPYVVAEVAVQRIPEEALRSVLQSLLPYKVRERARVSRRHDIKITAGPSRRTAVAQLTNDPIAWHVPVGPREWKRLGDCTIDDLEAIADRYFKRARTNEAIGKLYQRWADEMDALGVETFAELPGEIRLWARNGDSQ